VFLIIATQNLPYDYYTLLRFVVCGVSAYGAYLFYSIGKQTWVWIFIVIAVLFNPFAPIYLSKATWVFIDLIVALVYIVSLFFLKRDLKA
jgi:hypothetical protein